MEPTMINLKVLSAAAVVALAAPAMMPAQSFAQTPFNRPSGNLAARAGGTAAPSGGPRFNGGGVPHFNGGAHFSGGGGGGGNFHRGGGGFIPGAVAGAVIGGAIVSHGPRYGYGGGPYYNDNGYYAGNPDYYGGEYSDGPVVVDGPVAVQVAPSGGGDDVAYCMQTYRSYDPRSGTYMGLDGYRHPCP
jgi:hypothetical protein